MPVLHLVSNLKTRAFKDKLENLPNISAKNCSWTYSNSIATLTGCSSPRNLLPQHSKVILLCSQHRARVPILAPSPNLQLLHTRDCSCWAPWESHSDSSSCSSGPLAINQVFDPGWVTWWLSGVSGVSGGNLDKKQELKENWPCWPFVSDYMGFFSSLKEQKK